MTIRIATPAGSASSPATACPTYFTFDLMPALNSGNAEGGSMFSLVCYNDKDALATVVSHRLNLRGPSLSVQTFCSTSLVATHLACQALLNRDCDMALAGGVFVCLTRAGTLTRRAASRRRTATAGLSTRKARGRSAATASGLS